jgi:hypothetical protein
MRKQVFYLRIRKKKKKEDDDSSAVAKCLPM